MDNKKDDLNKLLDRSSSVDEIEDNNADVKNEVDVKSSEIVVDKVNIHNSNFSGYLNHLFYYP